MHIQQVSSKAKKEFMKILAFYFFFNKIIDFENIWYNQEIYLSLVQPIFLFSSYGQPWYGIIPLNV